MRHVAIRLDDDKYRRLRLTVVHRATTIQRAVELAIDRYLSESAVAVEEPPWARQEFRGFLAGTDVMEEMEQDRREELRRDRRRL